MRNFVPALDNYCTLFKKCWINTGFSSTSDCQRPWKFKINSKLGKTFLKIIWHFLFICYEKSKKSSCSI